MELVQCQLNSCCLREYITVPVLPLSSSSVAHLDVPPARVAASSGHDVTTVSANDDHVTGTKDESNATTPTLRFRLADDSFYDWIADGGGGGDASRRLMGESAAARFWERWLDGNWTTLPNATSDDDYDELLAALNAVDSSSTVTGSETMTDLRRDDARVSWMFSTKYVVQLVSSPPVGFTVLRCVSPLRRIVVSALRSVLFYFTKTTRQVVKVI